LAEIDGEIPVRFRQTSAPDRVDHLYALAVALTFQAAPIRYGSGNPTNQIGARGAPLALLPSPLSVDELELQKDRRNL
jgi:hypothetical protein